MCFSAEVGTNSMGQGGPIRHLTLFAEVAAAKLLWCLNHILHY